MDYAADNVRFVGAKTEVIAAFKTFVERCRKVGAQLNELETADFSNNSKIAALCTQEYDFLGERYTHAAATPTMKSTEKTMNKLKATWGKRGAWTFREMVCHYGILMYASSTLRVNMAERFTSLRHYSEVARRLQAHAELWDTPASVPAAVMADLTAWTAIVSANEAVPIPAYDEKEADRLICVDASGWGYGAVCVDLKSGHTMAHQAAWPSGSQLAGAGSVLTEPAAIKAAVYRFIQPAFDGSILVLTDHEGFVKAHPKGYANSWSYNELMLALGHFTARFVFQHIKGELNPVDGISRGAAATNASAYGAAARKLAASSIVTQSTRTFGTPLHRAQQKGISSAGVGYIPPNTSHDEKSSLSVDIL